MPTAAELQVILSVQDNASAQLRGLGQDVQRLERQVESAPEETDSAATADPAEAPPTPQEPAGADAQTQAQTRR